MRGGRLPTLLYVSPPKECLHIFLFVHKKELIQKAKFKAVEQAQLGKTMEW